MLAQSLSSADVHFVGLARGLSGYVVPSRLYGILAAGRPVIAAADEDSETAQLVRDGRLRGRHPARAARPAREEIREQPPASTISRRWAAAGVQWVEAEGGRERAVERYRALLDELLARRR